MTATQKLGTGRSSQFVDSVSSQIVEATDSQVLGFPYAAIPNMTITPVAGTYLVWLRGNVSASPGGISSGRVDVRISVGGVPDAASVSSFTTPVGVPLAGNVSSIARVTVNGAQAIVGEGEGLQGGTIVERQLMIERVS